jgi:hypothetical protein
VGTFVDHHPQGIVGKRANGNRKQGDDPPWLPHGESADSDLQHDHARNNQQAIRIPPHIAAQFGVLT